MLDTPNEAQAMRTTHTTTPPSLAEMQMMKFVNTVGGGEVAETNLIYLRCAGVEDEDVMRGAPGHRGALSYPWLPAEPSLLHLYTATNVFTSTMSSSSW